MMSFIIKKNIHGNDYYYLNENKRIEGKVKTKTIAYLGKDKKIAEKKMKEILEDKNPEKELIKEIIKLDRKEKTDKIFSIANTRGIFFNTASIYGGKAGFFTYGHLGKLLKNNWENLWRTHYLNLDENFYEIQSNNILPKKVFIASGHIENFNDPLVDCKKCKSRFRADHLLEEAGIPDAEALSIEEMNNEISKRKLRCEKCKGELTDVKQFNMMFPVSVGFDDSEAYLSPETAQGAYLVFKDEFLANRNKLPLGLAIIDKAYRNEISPRQGFFRLREFSQSELQIFFDPDKIEEHAKWDEVKTKKLLIKFSNEENIKEISCEELNKKGIPKFYIYYVSKVQDFYLDIMKIKKEKFRFRELSKIERAFYNKIHFDVEIILDTVGGFKEVGGVHYRTNHDLEGHKKVSGKNLEVSVDGKKFIPHVLELSFGVDRNVYSLLDVYFKLGKEGAMFNFPSNLAPIKTAVLPLVKNNKKITKLSKEILNELKKDFNVLYDESGSIGRRYARQDEIGTPFCITVDENSLKNKDATIRDRDTTKQKRIKISELKNILMSLIKKEIEFKDIK